MDQYKSSLSFWETHKPRASKWTHLLIASLVWSIVGVVLIIRGSFYAIKPYGWIGLLYCTPALILGFVKAKWVLDKTAHKIIKRIEERGDHKCIGGFISFKNYLLIVAMIFLGITLRKSGYFPAWFVAIVYVAIGAGLLFSSRLIWMRWRLRQEVIN